MTCRVQTVIRRSHAACLLALLGALAASPPAGAITYIYQTQDVMLPVNSYCSTYTGPGDLGTPSLQWATLDNDNTATGVNNEDHLFIYPKSSLKFDAGKVQNATCWFQLPSTFRTGGNVQITLVGHTPTFGFNSTTIDFDVRYKARARDESLGYMSLWSPWEATGPGEMVVTVPLAGTDLSSRTDPYELVPPAVAEPEDVVLWRVRRNGTTDRYESWFDVDYFMLTYETILAYP